MIYIDKSFQTLMQSSLKELERRGFATEPGSVMRMIISLINWELADDNPQGLYSIIQQIAAHPSTATGVRLDWIAAMFNVEREEGEGDEDFRYRLSNHTLVRESGNETAIRLAALSVPGVRDIIMEPYTMGPGSGTIYVVPIDYSETADLTEGVLKKIDNVKAYGSQITVALPETVTVKLIIQPFFKDGISQAQIDGIKYNVMMEIRNYINRLKPGQPIIISTLSQLITGYSDLIKDFAVTSFLINGNQANWTNQTIQWNKQFIESPASDAIQVI